ncbi:MAG TPA: class I SAM-dependent methyltransferase [Thermoleophilaceae bacterium]|nr:class I SAM-dependent methyltransferase [Thermoleophilaceae bacterium]
MTTSIDIDTAKLEAFAGQVFGDLAACYGGVMTSIGDRLGLYASLAGAGPLTAVEVADRSGCHERYVREWLNSQVAAGYIDYDASAAKYELPAEHAAVLADRDSPANLSVAFNVAASLWLDEERAIHAFRTGEGVAWGDHHERLFCGVAAFFGNAYRAQLVSQWLPALDGVVEKLEAGATVADVGCGHGHSTVLMAEAFPNSRFVGVDTHEASILAARAHAAEAGVDDRVTFVVGTAADLAESSFDLICFFDCLHDLGDPVAAAVQAHKALADGGTVMLVEPNAGAGVEENLGPIGRVYYSASTVLCCAHAISEGAAEPLGAQAGEERLAAVFAEAGFSQWRRATEGPFNLVLEARR